MRRVAALLGGCAVADDAPDDDHGWTFLFSLERGERAVERVKIIGIVDVLDRPSVAFEAPGNVFGEGQIGAALNGDLVAVVEPAQVGQLLMSRERGCLGADALHQTAVAGNRVDVVVEELVTGTVEGGRLPHAGYRHADAGRDASAKWPGGAFNTCGPSVLRMSRALGIELAELLQVL